MKVFISHSSLDQWVARKISEELNAIGIETFLDEKDIVTGESIDDSIGQHLLQSDEMLILISPASLKSQWVFVEIGGAKVLAKRLIPILFHVGANELPPLLSRYLARDLNEIETYYEEVKRRATRPKVSTPTKTQEKKPRRPKTPTLSVGDRVRIADLSELTDEQKQSPPTWVDRMDKYAGKEAKVEEIWNNQVFQGGQVCFLDIDGRVHSWSTLWLTKLA
jgi:hypothetical protein